MPLSNVERQQRFRDKHKAAVDAKAERQAKDEAKRQVRDHLVAMFRQTAARNLRFNTAPRRKLAVADAIAGLSLEDIERIIYPSVSRWIDREYQADRRKGALPPY